MKKIKEIQLIPIEFPQIDTFIHYFVCSDRKKVSAFIKERFDRDYKCTGSGLTMHDKGKDPIVWLYDKRPHVVAHEMIHAVRDMFKDIGHAYITDDNDEFFAYYVDYCVKEVLKN